MGNGRSLLGVFLLAVMLAGCGSGGSYPTTTPVLVLTATPVLLGVPTFETDAPISHEEIQRAVDHITGRDVDPTAPEVGPDGVVDQRIMDNLKAYNRMLAGKKAVNWQGWYKGTDSDMISIWMKDPPVPDGCCPQVTLWGITSASGEDLLVLKMGQHIQFSGTIDKANSAGQVEINDATITILP